MSFPVQLQPQTVIFKNLHGQIGAMVGIISVDKVK